MNTANIRPSTVDGIKQLAKKIAREHSISHTLALEVASRQAGYENFVHAKRQLQAGAKQNRYAVFLSIHWHAPRVLKGEPRPTGPRAGREILRVDLARALPDIVAKHRVSHGRGLHGFRMEYEDHLEHQTNVEGQSTARGLLLKAARSLRFMEATGLQPVSTKKYDEISLQLTKMPGKDHASDWFDPATEGYVCLDEPYAAAIKRRLSEREGWLESNGLKMICPAWEGIYYAGECTPHLISADSVLLERVARALAQVQAVAEPEAWPHETGICNDDFVSPKREADGKKRRRRPGQSWGDHNGASPYGGQPGVRSNWRPAKPMPFDFHDRLGSLMQGLSIGFSARVSKKLSALRSDLEDWSLMEHKDTHGDAAYDMYYGRSNIEYADTDVKRLDMLTTARSIIAGGYDDCKPRRKALEVIDAALSEAEAQMAKNIALGSARAMPANAAN